MYRLVLFWTLLRTCLACAFVVPGPDATILSLGHQVWILRELLSHQYQAKIYPDRSVTKRALAAQRALTELSTAYLAIGSAYSPPG